MQSAFIKADFKVAIEEVRHSKQKELRIIDTLEPVLMQHRLVVDEGLINRDFETAKTPEFSLFWQLTHLTRDRGCLKHDDRLDALAMAVAYWVDQMGQETGNAEEAHREKMLMAELDKFRRHVLGGSRNAKKWAKSR